VNCKDLEALLDPYLDGELDAAQRSSVEQHLESCADCRRRLDDLRALHKALQSPDLRFKASDTLKQRLRGELAKAAAHEARPRWPRYAAAAAIFAVALTLGWVFLPFGHGGEDENDAMADAAIAEHAQALTTKHLTEFASTDPAAVQSWFSGKLAYSPPVRGFAAQGYTLVGARLDHVKDEPAAALVYQHGADYVTVFVCPALKAGDTDLDADNDSGYNIVYWTKGSLSFWVVGKLDPADLKRFGESLHASI
jgi:anti-sigma factor RsiW